jgi:metal-sulfur cluster biosynthetic enzyme
MPTKTEVISSLRGIIDPHSNVSVYDMGLISELKVSKDSVSLVFRPTSPFCPLCMQLAMNIKRRLLDIKGMKKADITIVGHIQEDNINRTLADVSSK